MIRGSRIRVVGCPLLLVCAVACGAGSHSHGARAALAVELDREALADHPALIREITGRPHSFFRFVNVPFARAVCEAFADVADEMPVVNLHGDAHLEQYAATIGGRGLTDFDDATEGPAVVDLVRFGASIELACRAHGFPACAERATRAFFDGYRQNLRRPARRPRPPAVLERMLAGVSPDPGAFLAAAVARMEPIPPDEGARFFDALARFAEGFAREHPGIAPGFFHVKRAGYLRGGVGSALDRRLLFRVEGRTEVPEDDLVLEVKEVRDLGAIPCVQSGSRGPSRILLAQRRIGWLPVEIIGSLPLEGEGEESARFWIQSWTASFVPLSIDDPELTLDDLVAVAYDAGVQLGEGHMAERDGDARALRRAQLESLATLLPRIHAAIRDLTAAVLEAYERTRRELAAEAR